MDPEGLSHRRQWHGYADLWERTEDVSRDDPRMWKVVRNGRTGTTRVRPVRVGPRQSSGGSPAPPTLQSVSGPTPAPDVAAPEPSRLVGLSPARPPGPRPGSWGGYCDGSGGCDGRVLPFFLRAPGLGGDLCGDRRLLTLCLMILEPPSPWTLTSVGPPKRTPGLTRVGTVFLGFFVEGRRGEGFWC